MSEVQTVPHEARENVTHEEGPTQEFEPLFEDEGGFSEEGESQESGEATPGKTEETEAAVPEPEDKPKTEEKEPEKPKEEEPKKPPEGYVEIQALHAERHKRRESEERFQRELDALKAQMFSMQRPKEEAPADPFKDFKVLSDEEFKTLKEEDPDEAIDYLRKETRFNEYQRKQQAERELEAKAEYQQNQILSRAWEKINEVIPNVFERERPEVQETINTLNKFAEEQGFSPDEMAVLSNPATRVIVKDRNGHERVAMMADAAATFVKLLHGYSKVQGASLTKEREDAIRKEEREKAIAEITARVKKGETEFRSLVDAPTTSEKPSATKGNMTESEWSKLPAEEKRRLLGG